MYIYLLNSHGISGEAWFILAKTSKDETYIINAKKVTLDPLTKNVLIILLNDNSRIKHKNKIINTGKNEHPIPRNK